METNKGKKIAVLIVEDDITQAAAMKAIVENAGYGADIAGNARVAFARSLTGTYDVILLDRGLPDMDGIELCKKLKNHREALHIPIVIISAMDTSEDRECGLLAGADDYLCKPYGASELTIRIANVLKRRSVGLEIKRLEEELTRIHKNVLNELGRDAVTNLINNRQLGFTIEKQYRQAIQYKSHMSCIIIDVDNYTDITERRGPDIGEAILKTVAYIIQNSVRAVDTVSRMGGGMFGILTPMTKKEAAIIPASRIKKMIEQHKFEIDGINNITVSVGIADSASDKISTPEDLLHAAQASLFEAQQSGSGNIAVDDGGNMAIDVTREEVAAKV